MHAIADISIVPLGVGLSLSPYVAACERILSEAGLEPQLHANGTNVEGDWDEVMAALKRCHEALHRMGVPRVATNLRLGTRTDKTQTRDDKIASVRRELESEKVKR
ncbi:MAG: MTH1187 family thiamine-binding protein [Thermoanaerobaculales bacterium]|nr:MTH1187 family thiamine-binding protein [Thermoanaerobaculales bacterium]